MDDSSKLVKEVPYGQHVPLRCRNHPKLRWSTKNIAPLGARSIFFFGGVDEVTGETSQLKYGDVDGRREVVDVHEECPCPATDLELVPYAEYSAKERAG